MDLEFLNKLNIEMSQKFPLLESLGDLKTDGSVNRLDSTKQGDKAVWLCIHEADHKGNIYFNAVYGSWRHGVQYTCSSYDRQQAQDKSFQKTIKKSLEETKQKLELEKQEKYKSCREKWTPYYYELPQNLPAHDYLRNKKISSNHHARIDSQNVLFVPAWNSDGLFVGGQRIFLDPVTNKFEKRYTYGIEKSGSFCPFGNIRDAEFIYIAEGFATACSIARAFREKKNVAIACVWDTSNLLPGAQAVRRINPNSFLIFAADKDINSDPKWHNIGERKARQASNKLSNSLVKTVKFEASNDQWSDYNDLHQFEGLDKVMKQLHAESTDFIEIIPLGFNDKKYYYFATHKKQILDFTGSDHNPGTFTLNAPAKYWGDRYGYLVKQDGTISENPNWKKVIEGLGLESAKKGIFNHKKVRGVGAWEYNGEIIVNIGDKLYYNGEFYPLFNNGLKSGYFYQSSESVDLDFGRPLGNTDMLKFVEAFQMLRYKNRSDYIIVLGWIFAAQVFAALPWRPHIWFTGSKGIGKSTILSYVNEMIDFSLLVQDATAAGIRQRLENNAIAMIYDETEPNTEKDREKMAEVLTLARQSSTKGKYEVLRGSASGKAISYNTNTSFCMGSIQISEMNGADTSRFFVIEMNSIKDQPQEEFVRLQNAMAQIRPLSSGLFIRAVNMYRTYVLNVEKAIKVIKKRKIESRQADQLAPIIAGYHSYFSTEEMTESFIIETINELNFEQSDYVKANEENDSEKCLQDILELQIPGRVLSVGQIIEKYPFEANRFVTDEYDQLLGLIGLRFILANERPALFISSSSSALKKQLIKFSRYSDYKNVLKRHDNFVETKKQRVAGRSMNGIIIYVC